jgi:ribosomal protein S18 acetylase RimI-like enzyme
MPSQATPDPEPEITVTKSRKQSGDVWLFFDRILDVTDLDPAEEQMEAWEAKIDGDVVGMAVVDTIPSEKFIRRVAVKEDARQQGVASALLRRIKAIHGDVACRVHESNPAGHALVNANGFSKTESRFHELDRYETNPDE